MSPRLTFGLEAFVESEFRKYQDARLLVLCNQASVDRHLSHASALLTDEALGLEIAGFLGPQHGFRGERQDNMVESPDSRDEATGVQVTSLYSAARTIPESMVDSFDVIVVDLQDVGTRIYTFAYTMANCMRVAARFGKKVVVLDRPNPVNGIDIEGNLLEEAWTSFVGQFPICTRHGMTMGELARMFNEAFGIGCDLSVVPLRGWSRSSYWSDLGRPWVAPSPNVPTAASAIVFPGTVHFEGTAVSEGRGTTQPFEHVGAPYIAGEALADQLNERALEGVHFRACVFEPNYQKMAGQACEGVFIHVTYQRTFNAFETGITTLWCIARTYPEQFEWKQPPYEYEHDRMPIDLITGTPRLRTMVEEGSSLEGFLQAARKDVAAFGALRSKYLLY